jgi:site-specific recombinase XerD
MKHGHEQPDSRWGNHYTTRPVKSGTVVTYNRRLRTLFVWLVKEDILGVSPIDCVDEPVDRPDQIEPITDAEVEALLSAARKSQYPKRDEAVVWFLLDTGVRASELCELNQADVGLASRRCEIQKGRAVNRAPSGLGPRLQRRSETT